MKIKRSRIESTVAALRDIGQNRLPARFALKVARTMRAFHSEHSRLLEERNALIRSLSPNGRTIREGDPGFPEFQEVWGEELEKEVEIEVEEGCISLRHLLAKNPQVQPQSIAVLDEVGLLADDVEEADDA